MKLNKILLAIGVFCLTLPILTSCTPKQNLPISLEWVAEDTSQNRIEIILQDSKRHTTTDYAYFLNPAQVRLGQVRLGLVSLDNCKYVYKVYDYRSDLTIDCGSELQLACGFSDDYSEMACLEEHGDLKFVAVPQK